MEFYDPNNDKYNSLPDDNKKAKKKQPGKGTAWPNYPIVESSGEIEKDHIPNLFTVPKKDKDKTSQVFFPEQQLADADKPQEQSEAQIKSEFDEIVKGLSDLDQKYPPAETVWPQNSESAASPEISAPRTHGEDLEDYSQNPIDGALYNRQAEPVRRVSGYGQEEGEYFSGYVPGVAETVPRTDAPEAADSGRGGGNLPPVPPHEFGGESMPEDVPPSARPSVADNIGNSLNLPKSYEGDIQAAESKGMRKGFVAGAIVAWVVGRHLKNLKLKRERKEFNKEIGHHQEQIDSLQAENIQRQQRDIEHEKQINQYEAEQRKLKEQIDQKLAAAHEARPPVVYKPEHEPVKEQEAPDPLPTKPLPSEKPLQSSEKTAESHKQQEMIDAALRDIEKAVEDADKKRVEQDAWLRHELDEHGHEIQGQRRGQEYNHERAQELLQHQQQQQSDNKAGAQPVFATGAAQYQQPTNQQPELSSGQAPLDHRLPYDSHTPQGYLTSKRQHNPLVSALTSPWTFLMLSIILLAYFIATLL